MLRKTILENVKERNEEQNFILEDMQYLEETFDTPYCSFYQYWREEFPEEFEKSSTDFKYKKLELFEDFDPDEIPFEIGDVIIIPDWVDYVSADENCDKQIMSAKGHVGFIIDKQSKKQDILYTILFQSSAVYKNSLLPFNLDKTKGNYFCMQNVFSNIPSIIMTKYCGNRFMGIHLTESQLRVLMLTNNTNLRTGGKEKSKLEVGILQTIYKYPETDAEKYFINEQNNLENIYEADEKRIKYVADKMYNLRSYKKGLDNSSDMDVLENILEKYVLQPVTDETKYKLTKYYLEAGKKLKLGDLK